MSSKGGVLVRHFTTRRSRGNSEVTRNASISIRSKISGPVELIHTTNMLSYNAPDIPSRSASSTTASTKSDDDSDSTAPTVASSNASSPPTSPDVASSPGRDPSPEPNHLSCYFAPPAQSTSVVPSKPSPAPIVPQRASSHTKKSSEIMSRQRSVSRFSNQSSHSTSTKASLFSRSSSTSTATSHSSMMSAHSAKPSTSSFTAAPPPVPAPAPYHRKDALENPFGQELEKVTEIAEEFGVVDKLQATDDEERYMRERGLCKFKAEDYISEIQDLIAGLFADVRPAPAPMWI